MSTTEVRYPYPGPVSNLDEYRQLWRDPQRRLADYRLFWSRRPYKEDFSILVAGCGTSEAAMHAMRWPNAQVTGIDINATNVRCTEDLKHLYKLANLQLYQLPIDRVGELQMTFDQIVCTGALHHLGVLGDPDAGLAALRNVLKPDGAMRLIVYTPYGCAGIHMLHEFCKRVGIRATGEGIGQLIDALKALPEGHPLKNLRRDVPDFRDEAVLAEALQHSQDHAYSVPQLFEFLERGKMRFGRWVKQAPYSAHCGLVAQSPQAAHIAQLRTEEQFAAAEQIRGTMVRHSVIAYRDDASADSYRISFEGDGWLEYVPIRVPDTTCVQEQLTPGAVAMLTNQDHSYADLWMPISSLEKQLLDAIDGRRSIEQIIEATMPFVRRQFQLEPAVRFFEQLWWHDQVVFDTARAQ